MRQRSKRYRENKAHVVKTTPYTLPEAIAVLKKYKPAKFDETVEVSMELGIDTKKSDQMVRGAVSLPRGIGKESRVIVFCKEDKVPAAKAAGAIAAGGDELAAKIRDENWLDFDVAVATPDMMGVVGRLGKILGPQGKMPSPKSGTVTADFVTAVTEFRAGKIEFRADAGGNVHAPVGKASFAPEAIKENVETFVEYIRGLRPAATKGKFINSATLSTTMGPGVKIEVRLRSVMPNVLNKRMVTEIEGFLKEASDFVVVDFSGMKPKTSEEVRRRLRGGKLRLRIIKGSLARIAAKNAGLAGGDTLFAGNSALVYGGESIADVARVVRDLTKEKKLPSIKGAVVDKRALGPKQVTELANLPTRPELLAQLIGTIIAPLTNLLGDVNALLTAVPGLTQAWHDKREKQDEQAAPATVPAS